MQQIQDPITVDPVSGKLQPGVLIRTMAEIRDYLGNALLKYVADAWKTADGNNTKMISLLPELFQTRAIVFPQHVSTIDLNSWPCLRSLLPPPSIAS